MRPFCVKKCENRLRRAAESLALSRFRKQSAGGQSEEFPEDRRPDD